ncbi:DoxX family protein [Saccharothrix variisporea]|uniref:Putative oxidoreductase n=1 Tax=Saccharothrix variisporea TaxID=543527 RepID=A0A495XID5_9PSEU|nr:DoxX family protein [Saccharothrix variisporea]RKT72896.1 putative oxidoreductase [Saccharothrix variisporea]
MATHDDRSKASSSSGYSDDGFYSTSTSSTSSGGAHHFDAGTQSFGRDTTAFTAPSAFDKDTNTFDTSGFTPVTDYDPPATSHFDEEDERKPFGWSGSADLGLLVLRLALGGAFVAHGLQKVFGLFGGPGIDGFTRYLESSGYREARILAWVTGITELAGGGLLVLGLFTPLAAAGVLGVLANAIALKYRGGYFAPNGIELEVALAAMSFAVLFAGPGRAAFDYNRSWFRHPLLSGFLCLLVAAGATAATLYVFR